MGVVDDEMDRMGGRMPVPIVRFGALGDAWELVQARWGTWLLASAIVIICNSAISSVIVAIFKVQHVGGGGGFRMPLPPAGTLVQAVVSGVVNGFFVGGMLRMACRQIRGQSVRVEDLFSVTDVLPELLLGSVLLTLATALGFMTCFVPGLIVSGVLMFTLPLIVDARLPATEAMRQSWRALKRQWLMASLAHWFFTLVSVAGALLCCVGIFFTAPLYSLAVAVLYRDFFMTKPFPAAEKPPSWTG